MNDKYGIRKSKLDSKNFSLTTSFKGRTYRICDSMQYSYLINRAKDIVYSSESKPANEDEFNQKVKKIVEDEGFITLEELLKKMTPDEIKTWKMSYRYSPVFSNKR